MKAAPVEAQIAPFVEKYSADVAAQLRAARAHLRSRFPRGFELVYDNYNALVFAFAPTVHASEAVLSIAGYPRWVTLFFLRGVELDDPTHLLQGAGSQVRGIRLATPAQLEQSDVAALIEQAAAPYRSAFASAEPLQTVIRAVSAKQRDRRPSSAPARPASLRKRARAAQ
jgi:hypothetical protein